MENKAKYGEVNIKYCPMDDVIGDYFTKPLQGAKFRKFIDKVLFYNQEMMDQLSQMVRPTEVCYGLNS